MRRWSRTDMPLLQGGEDSASAPFTASRTFRVENGLLRGVGVVEQVPDWTVAATLSDGVGTTNAVIGGGQFATQGGASDASAGVAFSLNLTDNTITIYHLGDDDQVMQQVQAWAGYVEAVPPQITGFEMFQRYYANAFGNETVATRLGMGYYDPTANTFTVPTFVLGGGPAARLRFRGIAKHRGATILGWGYYTETIPDKSHVLRYCKYGDPDTWVPDTTPTSAGFINVGTLNIPIVACAASGPYTVIGKTSEIFVLDGDYSEQFSLRQIGTAHGPVSTAGMVSTGPVAMWMGEKGPAYSVNGADVRLLTSERIIRRMTTYMDLPNCSAVHDATNTRVGFLCRQRTDLDGVPVSTNWPSQILWWDYERDALHVQGVPTTCWSIFTTNAVNPPLNGPVGAPANLASTPNTTGASLSWDHSAGDPLAQVSVEYGLSGGTLVAVGPTAVGATSWTLTGLLEGTSYDWRLRYFKNGQYGSYTATQTFATNTIPADPTDVVVAAVSSYASGGVTYVRVGVTWTQTEFASGATFEVYENTVNDASTATLVASGSASTTGTVRTKAQDPVTTYYYWVLQRLSGGQRSNFVAASGNPILYIPPVP